MAPGAVQSGLDTSGSVSSGWAWGNFLNSVMGNSCSGSRINAPGARAQAFFMTSMWLAHPVTDQENCSLSDPAVPPWEDKWKGGTMICPHCKKPITIHQIAVEFGRKGGSVKSEAKAAAARINGRKGGERKKGGAREDQE